MKTNNKRGEAYVFVCTATLILCMLISVFVSFASAVNIVKQTERNSRVVLDSFVMQNSIEIYNSIKNGHDETESLDAGAYISAFSAFNSLDFREGMLYAVDEDGNEQYRLTKPTMRFVQDNHLKIQVEYNAIIPLYFAGIKISEAEVPITVISKLDERF